MKECNSYCLYYPHSDRIPDYIIDKNGVKHVMNSKKYRCDYTDELITHGILCPFFRNVGGSCDD